MSKLKISKEELIKRTKNLDAKGMINVLLEASGIYESDVDELQHMSDELSIEIPHEWGGEGEGDSIGFVIKFPNDVFIKISGSYNSWDGSDYSYADIKFVKPKEKTIIVYE